MSLEFPLLRIAPKALERALSFDTAEADKARTAVCFWAETAMLKGVLEIERNMAYYYCVDDSIRGWSCFSVVSVLLVVVAGSVSCSRIESCCEARDVECLSVS